MITSISPRLTYAAAPPPGPAPAPAPVVVAPAGPGSDLLDRVKLHGKAGWNVGKQYGGYIGTVAGVGFCTKLGLAVGAQSSPGAALAGLAVGFAAGVVEERYLGVGQAVGGFFTGISGAVYGGLAGAIRKQ